MAGVYVHIPFCARRCIYCDFYSTMAHERIDDYIDAVVAEARCRCDELHDDKVKTLYLGGGTPSQLSTNQITVLVKGLSEALPLNNIEEFTVEVNPDDITPEYAVHLRSVGVNRISMGVQSFNDTELAFMRRRHDAGTVELALRTLRSAGIRNISIDLIYGIPGQTMETWEHSVDKAISLDVQHISAYCLSYEHGTALWQMRSAGELDELPDELCVKMHYRLAEKLKHAGYEHYEISNYSKKGFQSMHNSSYWDGTPYLGLGASAHSFDGESRRYNPSDLFQYMQLISSNGYAYAEERMKWWECYDEMVMLYLRTAAGLDTAKVRQRFGTDAYEYLMRQAGSHLKRGNLILRNDNLIISPTAIMMSDAIIRDLFYEF